jgi:hypothetical protein
MEGDAELFRWFSAIQGRAWGALAHYKHWGMPSSAGVSQSIIYLRFSLRRRSQNC